MGLPDGGKNFKISVTV